MVFETDLEHWLIRYCSLDSQSDDSSPSQPSTDSQRKLAAVLAEDLRAIGVTDVQITEYGAVLATIPATAPGPRIGFLAHMDTAPAFAACGVKPVVHRAYDGGSIRFADEPGLELSPQISAYLGQCLGHDIVTASGKTLLGADDKAGVAILMALTRHLVAEAGYRHGLIRIAFTPDEEIGRGVDPRLIADLGVEYAYTLDGGARGEVEYESFSADGAVVRITGVSCHPGAAKGKMVNAATLAARLVSILPQATLTPEVTEGREGFIHLYQISGGAAEAELRFILRDFERDGLAAKADILHKACAALQAAEPRAQIYCEIKPQYRNMRYWLEQDMTPVDLARAAFIAEGITPVSVPIRGGTDGSRLTELGVPCPNLFTGMQEIHGPLEWVSLQDMAAATRCCLRLVQLAAQ